MYMHLKIHTSKPFYNCVVCKKLCYNWLMQICTAAPQFQINMKSFSVWRLLSLRNQTSCVKQYLDTASSISLLSNHSYARATDQTALMWTNYHVSHSWITQTNRARATAYSFKKHRGTSLRMSNLQHFSQSVSTKWQLSHPKRGQANPSIHRV